MFEKETVVEKVKVVVFRLKNEEYGVDVDQVKSIERLEPITRVPKTPPFVKGVINLRGIVTPVIHLRGRFQLDEEEYTDHTRIIVVSVKDMEVGLIVDAAEDVLDVPLDAIEPPPEVVGGIEAAYLRGMAKLDERLLVLLNLDQVLNQEELKQVQEMEITS